MRSSLQLRHQAVSEYYDDDGHWSGAWMEGSFSADILKNVKSNNTNITVLSRFQQQPKNTLLYSVLAAADRE